MSKVNAAILAAAATAAFSVSSSAWGSDLTVNPTMTVPGQWFVSEMMSGANAFNGDGTDVFTILLPMGSRDLNLASYNVNVGLFGQPTTSFSSVAFSIGSGVIPVPTVNVGPFGFAQYSMMNVAGPFGVAVTGASDGGYTLYMSLEAVTPVPEPETYAMFFAGLAALGFLAKRSFPR